jgi:hypothetical protein
VLTGNSGVTAFTVDVINICGLPSCNNSLLLSSFVLPSGVLLPNMDYTFDVTLGYYDPTYGLEDTSETFTQGFFNPTPLPATLPLFATGLGAMGLLGWRKKRKNAAVIAAARSKNLIGFQRPPRAGRVKSQRLRFSGASFVWLRRVWP